MKSGKAKSSTHFPLKSCLPEIKSNISLLLCDRPEMLNFKRRRPETRPEFGNLNFDFVFSLGMDTISESE